MKPRNIFLIRHGQSEGNVDKDIYARLPDYAIGLTELGQQEAAEAGRQLRTAAEGRFFFYISSYRRTRQTFEGIAQAFKREDFDYREDPRITEQSWAGRLQAGGVSDSIEKDRDAYGHFYYRIDTGESNLEVYTRISSFLDTLFRDFAKEQYPENAALILHGMSMRVFLMRWFHWTVEEFESLRNPKNCDIIQLQLQGDGKYQLVTSLKKYERSTHPYQFPIHLPPP